MSKEIRTYVAAAVFVILLVLLIGYLTFFPVPSVNKDLIVAIIGVLVGKASGAMDFLFGSTDELKEEFEKKMIDLEKANSDLRIRYETLRENYDQLTTLLVERHIIEKEGFNFQLRDRLG